MNYFKYRIIFFLLATPVYGYSQNKVVEAFDKFRTANYQEKVYVHTDRSTYMTGESMWFKLYLVDGGFHQPSAVSKVVYLEILDGENQSVLNCKVEVFDGSGNGMLYIPVSLNTGSYTVRAYTAWMRNFSPDFYFHKDITIINPFKIPENQPETKSPGFSASFFPEGGNFVAGIKAKVGFQIIDATGRGIDCSGIVLNEKKDTVAVFSPDRFGIGNFYFTPQPDQKYNASIQDGSGLTQQFELPAVLPVGFSMTMEDREDILKVHVTTNETEALYNSVFLFVHSRNRIVKAYQQKLREGTTSFRLDFSELPPGISHFTVFDENLRPRCERLYFRQPESDLTFKLRTGQKSYATRSQVKLALEVEAAEFQNPFDLSVAVFKTDVLPSSGTTIENYLLLTSELKGDIESPGYYFEHTNESRVAADNLMLTHGWRRFVWQEVLQTTDVEKEFIPELKGHIIQGLITDDLGKPVSGSIAYLSSPSTVVRTYPGRSKKDGKIYFGVQRIYGKSKIVAQLDPKIDSTSILTIASPFSLQFANRYRQPLILSSELNDQLVDRSISMQVENIYSTKLPPASLNLSDSAAFFGKADATYFLDDYTRFQVLEEVLREYVPGVFVRIRKDGFHFLVVNKELNTTFRTSPMILLDGVPVFDEDEIMSFDPRLIKKLEIVQKRWFLGPVNAFGIVSFTTYQGDLAGFELNPNSIVLDYDGLQLHQEFYSPRYENKNQRDNRLPDQRTLLYWNPGAKTDEKGMMELEFYSSDIPGDYKVVVEGMNAKGELINASTTFKVNISN